MCNRANGEKCYACAARVNGKAIMGISDNTTSRTDGALSGAGQLKRLDLPSVVHDRG